VLVDAAKPSRRVAVPADAEAENLLVPLFRAGRAVFEPPSAEEARQRALDQVGRLDERFKRLRNPEIYPVGLEQGLFQIRQEIIASIKQGELQKTR
jgi:nicotinate phosphoribosyltransferase